MKTTAHIEMVDTPEKLEKAVMEISKSAVISIDTESNSLYAYQEEVCLMQISTKHKDYLIDTLCLDDITAFDKIFRDPSVEKIFHAAEYDLICLYRDFGFEFCNLFDTMIAARILGVHSIGLGNLLKEHFNIKTNKKYQRANWGKRPLTQQMQNYAVLDTRYLFELRQIFHQQLEEKDLLELAEEDFKREIEKIHHLDLSKTYKEVWRYPNAKDLSHEQLAILQALADERDLIAQMKDKPLFKIIEDKHLTELAKLAPQTKAEIEEHTDIPQKLINRYSHWILKAVKNGILSEPIIPPKVKRPSDAYLENYYALREWRKTRAREWGVESDVILPRDVMQRLASHRPATEDALKELMSDVPWRYAHFNQELLAQIVEPRRVTQ